MWIASFLTIFLNYLLLSLMTSPILESLFIDFNSGSDSLPKRFKCRNDVFKDLIFDNKSDALFLILFFMSSFKYPAKRYKLRAINI